MRSAEDMERLFKKAGLTVRQDTDERMFQDVLRARQDTIRQRPASRARIWRIAMRHPISRLAVAAVVVIAGLIGLSFWRGTGSGVALADVLARIEQFSTYSYKVSGTTTSQVGVGGMTVNTDTQSTMLVSTDRGMKMTTKQTIKMPGASPGQESLSEMYMLPRKKVWLTIMPDQKKYVRMDCNDILMERQQKQNNDPTALVELVLRCKYQSLGRSVVDGIQVEGFRTTDPNYMAGMFGQADVKIWVDVKTQLPVRSEVEVHTDQMQMHMDSYDFQWDVPVSGADFDPVIPEDYQAMSIKMPVVTEEGAVQGLRLYAELMGRYPEKLDMMALMSETGNVMLSNTPAAKRLREEMKGLAPDDMGLKIAEIMSPFQGLAGFHMSLVAGKKDPVYYGKTVGPQDADKVLLRWKGSDTEYRVVFGDLHAENVTPEALLDLEKGMVE